MEYVRKALEFKNQRLNKKIIKPFIDIYFQIGLDIFGAEMTFNLKVASIYL